MSAFLKKWSLSIGRVVRVTARRREHALATANYKPAASDRIVCSGFLIQIDRILIIRVLSLGNNPKGCPAELVVDANEA